MAQRKGVEVWGGCGEEGGKRDGAFTVFDVSLLLCGSWRTVFVRGQVFVGESEGIVVG